MEEKTIAGEKIKLKWHFLIIWLVLLLAVLSLLAVNVVQYVKYQKVQQEAISVMVVAYSIADSDFDSSEYSTEELCEFFFDELEPFYYRSFFGIDASDLNKALSNKISAARELLETSIDYPYYDPCYVFEYTNYFDYIFGIVKGCFGDLEAALGIRYSDDNYNPTGVKIPVGIAMIILCLMLVVLLPTQLVYLQNQKKEIKLIGKSVFCSKSSGKELELPIERISKIKKKAAKGIKLKTPGESFKILLLKNNTELINAITDEMNQQVSNVSFTGSNDEYTKIEQLKKLLDSGAITQEEFDIKKKQLLGL